MLIRPVPSRPAVPLALAALSGAVLGPLLPGGAWALLLALASAVALAARRRAPGLLVPALLLACGAGFGLRASTVAGASLPAPEPVPESGWLELELLEVQPAPHGRARLLGLGPAGAMVELDVPASAVRALLPGARVAALVARAAPSARARSTTPPPQSRTQARLLRQGVSQRLRAEVLIERSGGRGLQALLAAAERGARGLVERASPPDRAAFLRTVLLGDRTSLGPALQETFRDTGTIHLLSISGLHVGLVAGLLLAGGRLIGLPRRERRLGAALGILLYAALAGASVPVLRSALAGLVVCCAPGRGDPWNRLAVGLLLVLAWDPAAPGDTDLQLSFGVTAAILALAPPFTRLLIAPARRARGRVRAAVAAWTAGAVVPFLASTPLIWACLGQVSPASLLANALAVPLCSLVLGLGLLGILVGALLPGLGLLLLQGADLATAAMFRLLELLAALPGARFDLVRPAPWVAVLAAGLVAHGAARREAGRPAWWAFGLALLLLLPAPLPSSAGQQGAPRILVRRGGASALVAVGPLARSLGPPPRDEWRDVALRRLGCAAIEPAAAQLELAPGLRCESHGRAWIVRRAGQARPLLLLAPRLRERELAALLARERPLRAIVGAEVALPAGVERIATDHDDLLLLLDAPP